MTSLSEMHPKVSVLIPTYNSASYLEEAIQSVLDQTYNDYELIIVDNQSTDNTDELVGKFLKDKRVAYYKNSTNLGMAGNWNRCIMYSNGEYIKFLCSDDKFHPSLLETYVSVLDSNPKVSIISSYREAFGENFKSFIVKPPTILYQNGRNIIKESLLSNNWIGEPSSIMFRRSDLWVGIFKTELKYIIDWEMWLRILTIGDCYIVPEVLSYFRQHNEQGTVWVKRNFINLFEEYYFYKSIKNNDLFYIEYFRDLFEKQLKVKAYECTLMIYYFFKNNKIVLMKKALQIGYEEQILCKTIFTLLKRYINHNFGKLVR